MRLSTQRMVAEGWKKAKQQVIIADAIGGARWVLISGRDHSSSIPISPTSSPFLCSPLDTDIEDITSTLIFSRARAQMLEQW